MADTWDLFADIAAITAWLDESNPHGEHEDAMRVLKLTGEAGEAAAAYIGMVGQNPRKGVTHTQADLLAELADVAVTALCAMQHFTQDAAVTRGMLAAKVAGIVARAGIGSAFAAHAAAMPMHFADPEHLSRAACGATSESTGLQVALDPGDDRIDCPGCRTWLAAQERTSGEWEALYGFIVLDPDGWRVPDAPDWDAETIGLREFYRRACASTTNMVATGAAERIRRDLAFLPQDAAPVAAGGA